MPVGALRPEISKPSLIVFLNSSLLWTLKSSWRRDLASTWVKRQVPSLGSRQNKAITTSAISEEGSRPDSTGSKVTWEGAWGQTHPSPPRGGEQGLPAHLLFREFMQQVCVSVGPRDPVALATESSHPGLGTG